MLDYCTVPQLFFSFLFFVTSYNVNFYVITCWVWSLVGLRRRHNKRWIWKREKSKQTMVKSKPRFYGWINPTVVRQVLACQVSSKIYGRSVSTKTKCNIGGKIGNRDRFAFLSESISASYHMTSASVPEGLATPADDVRTLPGGSSCQLRQHTTQQKTLAFFPPERSWPDRTATLPYVTSHDWAVGIQFKIALALLWLGKWVLNSSLVAKTSIVRVVDLIHPNTCQPSKTHTSLDRVSRRGAPHQTHGTQGIGNIDQKLSFSIGLSPSILIYSFTVWRGVICNPVSHGLVPIFDA